MYSDQLTRVLSLPLVAEILARLDSELPQRFTYHNVIHSRDVLAEAVFFACEDGKSPREIELIAIAAAFHDAGYVFDASNNELKSAELASEAMRVVGEYAESEIALVRQMILDTRLLEESAPYCQEANTELSGYLLDADLSNFGREDFFKQSQLVFSESQNTEAQHYRQTLRLLSRHKWFTPAAKRLRQAQKEENVRQLERLLQALAIS